MSRIKSKRLKESRDKVPIVVRAKATYLHPRKYPERVIESCFTTNKEDTVDKLRTNQEEEIIIPKVPSPRAGTSASFRQKDPESILKPAKVQVIPRVASRKGKAWVRPPIIKEVVLLSKISEEDVNSENEYVVPTHKVEFFYVKKDLFISEETK